MSFEIQLPNAISSISFAFNGLIYAVGCEDNCVYIWAVGKSEKEILKFEFASCPVAMSFDESDLFLLIACEDGVMHLVDLDENKVKSKLEGKKRNISSLCFLPSDQDFPQVVCATTSAGIELWDLMTNKIIKNFENTNTNKIVRFSPCGRWLVVMDTTQVQFFNLLDGESKKFPLSSGSNTHQPSCFQFHPTKLMATFATKEGLVINYEIESETVTILESPSSSKLIGLVYDFEGEMLVGIYVDYIKIISSSVPFEGAHLKIGKTELTGASLVETGELVVYSMVQDNNSIFTYVVHSEDIEKFPNHTTFVETPVVKQSFEDHLADSLLSSSTEACTLLANRLDKVKISNSLLSKRKITSAIEQLSSSNDLYVIYDVLCQSLFNTNAYEVEVLALRVEEIIIMVPLLKLLLGSPENEHIRAALLILRNLATYFPTLIKSNNGLHENFVQLRRQCTQFQSNMNFSSLATEFSKTVQAM